MCCRIMIILVFLNGENSGFIIKKMTTEAVIFEGLV